MARQIQVLHN